MALMHVECFSNTLGMAVSMDVILPQKTKGQIGMEGARGAGPYPTLYLLHGMSDNHTIWQRRTSIERYADAYDLAVVMPSTELGWYTDMHMGLKWFSYIGRELPGICRSFFPVSDRREDTFVAGLSMGGYGAIKLALTLGEQYACAATLSGAVGVTELLEDRERQNPNYWKSIFGPAASARGGDDDLFALAGRRAAQGMMPRLYQWCGTEDFLIGTNRLFRDHLRGLGYDLTYSEGPGDHSWGHWDDQIQKVLAWLPLTKKS